LWWLLLAPSAFGAVLFAAGASWELVLSLHRRRLRPAQLAPADPS